VIIGNILLETSVVTLFSENGVPVMFISRYADEVAFAIPAKGGLPAHYLLQRAAMRDVSLSALFTRWAATHRAGIQRRVVRKLYRGITDNIRLRMGENDYDEMIAYLRPSDNIKWAVVTGFITSIFKGVIIEELYRAGLDPHPGIMDMSGRYGLANDFCNVVDAEIDFQALQFLKCSIVNPLQDKKFQSSRLTEQAVQNIVHRFENRRLELQKMLSGLIEDFVTVVERR